MSDGQVGYSKLRSRTFWLAVVWTAFVPVGLVVQGYMASRGFEGVFMGPLITQSGIVVAAYVGGGKIVSAARESRGGKG